MHDPMGWHLPVTGVVPRSTLQAVLQAAGKVPVRGPVNRDT